MTRRRHGRPTATIDDCSKFFENEKPVLQKEERTLLTTTTMTSTGMQPAISLEMAETAVPTLKVMRLQKPELHMVCFGLQSFFFSPSPKKDIRLSNVYFCLTLYICFYQSIDRSINQLINQILAGSRNLGIKNFAVFCHVPTRFIWCYPRW